MDEFKIYDQIICIDLKCFFASVECNKLNKDPHKFDLAVADTTRGKGSVVLAISPALRAKNVKNRTRIYELPRNINIHFAKPCMQDYVDVSNEILKMYLRYFAREDILVYSIDEVFIDATSYLKLYKTNVYNLTSFLLTKIKEEFNLEACAGIGNNMLLSKYALDIEAKHKKDNIAIWTYDDLPEKLWPITNLSKVWGIGKGIEKRLHKLNINSMYDLAHYDVYQLVKEFGIMGEELYLHAHGIDISKINQQEFKSERKSYNIGHTLYQDSPKDNVRLLIRDLVKELSHKLRSDNKTTSLIHIHIRYGYNEKQPSLSFQSKLSTPLISYDDLLKETLKLFDQHVLDLSIRKVGLSYSKLEEFSGEQLSIFDINKKNTPISLEKAYDKVNDSYGKNTVIKASSLCNDSYYFKRSKLLGGHNREK